jgi:PIN domain nuclease of toxin-antitoxin system
MSLFLLDTHAFLWWVDGTHLGHSVVTKLTQAMKDRHLRYSPITMWEIGMLESKSVYNFVPNFEHWTRCALEQSGAGSLPLSAKAAILSSRLPGDFHKDPADRLLVASAIDAGATFVTRDAKILDWAARTGALKVLAC